MEAVSLYRTYLGGFSATVLPYANGAEGAVRAALPADVVSGIDSWLAANQHPLSKGLPLMNPFHVLLIVLGYVLSVFVGRTIMAYFSAWSLKTFAKFHNLVLILLSGYMCYGAIAGALRHGFGLWGNGIESDQKDLAAIIWVFYISKILEFADTWIMLLKKNFRQVSFLHIYHHGTIFPIWWWICFSFPGGDSYFSCAQNSFIHVVMYSYYLARCFNIPVPAGIKFLVTKGQMFQFLLNLFQATYVIVLDTAYPKAPAYLLLVYMVTLLALFNNFRVKGEAEARAQAQRTPVQKKNK